ncbi:MAG TPA: hypothetical protein GX506_07770 [Firmicutes bacterium]|nr:hypothetical protein [Bacillota bacterium]
MGPGGGALASDLKLVRGIGPKTEARLKDLGYRDIPSLASHPRWSERAAFVLEAFDAGDISGLRAMGAKDDQLLATVNPGDAVFLDIETTGLYFTLPLFLIGMLYRIGEGLIMVEQYLARTPEEEGAILEAAMDRLSGFKTAITYNGRRFDIPYLRARAAMMGTGGRLNLHEIDLLMPVRRRYRGLLPDCRLSTAGTYLMGLRRDGDIPGWMVPEIYYRFIDTRCADTIRPVLEHNIMDLLTLELLSELLTQSSGGIDNGGP